MKKDYSAVHEVCPKCGEPFLYAKDWDEAGALFVHGYHTDAGSGQRFPIACHVPEQVALGRLTMNEWRENRVQGDMSKTREDDFREALFGTDATPGPYRGYTKGDDWNGWATPYFEFEVAIQVAKDSSRLNDGTRVTYDESRDAFLYEDAAYPDEPVSFEAITIGVEDQEKKVYPVGTYYWTWEVAE